MCLCCIFFLPIKHQHYGGKDSQHSYWTFSLKFHPELPNTSFLSSQVWLYVWTLVCCNLTSNKTRWIKLSGSHIDLALERWWQRARLFELTALHPSELSPALLHVWQCPAVTDVVATFVHCKSELKQEHCTLSCVKPLMNESEILIKLCWQIWNKWKLVYLI